MPGIDEWRRCRKAGRSSETAPAWPRVWHSILATGAICLRSQGCRTNCAPQRCGDGVLDNMKGEVCDDGNTTSGDGCSSDCKSAETCGNGITETETRELILRASGPDAQHVEAVIKAIRERITQYQPAG